MKIVISFSKTKREITGSFEICGSERDLRHIANTILGRIGDKDEEPRRFGYGWVSIPSEPLMPPIVNTAPIMWDDAVSTEGPEEFDRKTFDGWKCSVCGHTSYFKDGICRHCQRVLK